jgi:hypothetical protein
MIYDITHRNTFQSIRNHMEDIKNYAGSVPVLLLANKSDLNEIREV